MKKYFAILSIGLSFTSVNAQQIKESEVPSSVKASFAKMYPQVKKTTWDKENNQYEASYVNGQNKGSVLFEANGKWSEREVVIPTSQLPLNALQYLKKQYKGQPLKAAAKITKSNGEVQYEAEIPGEELFFTKEGLFIKADRV
jgi:hypothetical protein